MTDKEQEKSVHSMLDGAEIYSRDFFVEHGKRGGKIGGLKSASVSEEERSKRAKKGWATRRKLSTD